MNTFPFAGPPRARCVRRIALAAVLLLAARSSPACDAWTVGAGLAALQPHGGRTHARVHIASNAVTTAAGIPPRFAIGGLSADAGSIRTLAVTMGCEFASHWLLQADAGIPPRVRVEGSGVVAPPGPTGALTRMDLHEVPGGRLVEQRIWNPLLALRYRLGDADDVVQPFVSAGASFTWFTDERVSAAFDQALDQQFGQALALSQGRPGRTHTRVSVASSWTPVLGAGAEWHVTREWSLSASLGYAWMRAHARLRTTAADGAWLATARSGSDLEVTGIAVIASYRFGAQD